MRAIGYQAGAIDRENTLTDLELSDLAAAVRGPLAELKAISFDPVDARGEPTPFVSSMWFQ